MIDLDHLEALAKAATEFAPGYFVDCDGNVYSTDTNWRGYGPRQLKLQPNSHGYLRVRILIGGRRVALPVHKLVAAAFLEERPGPQYQIRHLNGVRTDNRAKNLAWGTAAENAADRKLHGTEMGAVNGKASAFKRRKSHCLRGHRYDLKYPNGNNRCSACDEIRTARRPRGKRSA